MQRVVSQEFPWGTLAVNTLGSFLYGFVWSLAESRGLISAHVRTILLIGFMGSFTTFSSFAFETAQHMHRGEMLSAGANILLNNVLCISLVFAGVAVARWI